MMSFLPLIIGQELIEPLAKKYMNFVDTRINSINNTFSNYLKQDILQKKGFLNSVPDVLKKDLDVDNTSSLLKNYFNDNQLSAISSVLKSGAKTAGDHIHDIAGASATVGIPTYGISSMLND